MIYVETNSIIGSENLAFEEYFLKKEDISEPVLMLWRNRPTIVVGAFQNTHEEICEEFVKANKIDVVKGQEKSRYAASEKGGCDHSVIPLGILVDGAVDPGRHRHDKTYYQRHPHQKEGWSQSFFPGLPYMMAPSISVP